MAASPSRMPSTRSAVSVVVPCILGVAAGVLASLVMSSRGSNGPVAAAAPVRRGAIVVERDAASPAAPSTAAAQIRAMDRRLAAIEAREPGEPGAPDSPPDPAQVRAEQQRAHDDAIAAHRSAAIDPAWAARADTGLTAQLAGMAQASSFAVLDVDCRTATCTAELEWPSYGAAVEQFTTILHGRYDLNCDRRILLPEPADPAIAYRATAVFDCTGWRAAGEPPP